MRIMLVCHYTQFAWVWKLSRHIKTFFALITVLHLVSQFAYIK